MTIPHQSAPVQRTLLPAHLREPGVLQAQGGEGRFSAPGRGVGPSGAEQCYAYQGEARNVCLSLYQG